MTKITEPAVRVYYVIITQRRNWITFVYYCLIIIKSRYKRKLKSWCFIFKKKKDSRQSRQYKSYRTSFCFSNVYQRIRVYRSETLISYVNSQDCINHSALCSTLGHWNKNRPQEPSLDYASTTSTYF